MKTILCIIFNLLLFSTTYAQLDYADFELFTRTAGSSADTIRFWMIAEDPVWDDDGIAGLGDQRLTSSFDSAHATYWANESVKGVPVPYNDNNLWNMVCFDCYFSSRSSICL